MKKIIVTCGWIGDGKTTATAWRPEIVADHKIMRCEIQPPIPERKSGQSFAVLCIVEESELAKIQANPKYRNKVTVRAD